MAGLFDLNGKVSLVTGGSRGIGLAMANGLAQSGSDVMIWDVSEERNSAALQSLAAHGVKAQAMVVDVSNEARVVTAMVETVERLGRVDTVVANAGISRHVPSFLDLDLENFRNVTAVNQEGWMFTVREALRHMKERAENGDPGGSIIGQSSLQATHGSPGNQAYGASKGAVIAMIKSIAVEFGRYGVRANAIMPGFIKTEMNKRNHDNVALYEKVIKRMPIRRWGEPDDLVGLAVYFASDVSRYHTGTTIELDGGYSAL